MKLPAAIFIIVSLMLCGCAESPQDRAQRLEPMLSAAGFHMLPADTPQREQELASHTPLKMRYHFSNGRPHYCLPILTSATVSMSVTKPSSRNTSNSSFSS